MIQYRYQRKLIAAQYKIQFLFDDFLSVCQSTFMQGHIVNHIEHSELKNDSILHVIGVISNPSRFHSRYRLARDWVRRMSKYPNVKLYLVECAFGDRHYEMEKVCAETGTVHHKLRTKSEVWIKENMINIGVRDLLPHDWKYLAWVDCDINFCNPDWSLETIHQLQHFAIVQPWQSACNLGPTGNVSKSFDSVGQKIHLGISPVIPKKGKRYTGDPYTFGHSGYAWACTRTFWENVGGLIDFAILGSADHHMALGCRGYYSHSVHSMMKGDFMRLCHAWQTRAIQITHGEIGYVDGRIEHFFHGPMQRRNYVSRWEILIQNEFNPIHDLRRDHQGLIQLIGKPKLEQDIRRYNRQRMEDSIEEY